MDGQRSGLDAALHRLLGPKLRQKLLEYVRNEELGLAARKCQLPRARLSELLHQRRPLTLYYLMKFLDGGIVTMADLLKGVDLERDPIKTAKYIRFLASFEDDEVLKAQNRKMQKALRGQPALRDRMLQAFVDAPDRLSDALKLLGY